MDIFKDIWDKEPEYKAEVQDGYDHYTLESDSIDGLSDEISDYLEIAPIFEQDIIIDVSKNS